METLFSMAAECVELHEGLNVFILMCYRSAQDMNVLFFPQPSSSSPSKTGTLQTRSVTASQLATDSPAKMNGHYHDSGSKYKTFQY